MKFQLSFATALKQQELWLSLNGHFFVNPFVPGVHKNITHT